MKTTTPEPTREHTETFECITCAGNQQFDTRLEFREHMAKAHGLKEMKGTKKMVFHLDTATHFISTYECEVEGLKFFLTTNTERENAFRLRKMKLAHLEDK